MIGRQTATDGHLSLGLSDLAIPLDVNLFLMASAVAEPGCGSKRSYADGKKK